RAGLSHPHPALAGVPGAIEDTIRAGLEPEPSQRADLATFTARLRGAHLQTLADRLAELASRAGCAVHLHIGISTADASDLAFRPVPCTAQVIEPTRNMLLVPEPAPVAAVRTGDLVRFDVTADAEGYLTMLNLGSSGELKVVFPTPLAGDNRIQAG